MLTFLLCWVGVSILTAAILCRLIHVAKVKNGEIFYA